MADPRITKLANVLVDYSVSVQPGDWVMINAHTLAEPLTEQVLKAVLQAGGNPTLLLSSDVLEETYLRFSDQDQLQWISPTTEMLFRQADVRIAIMAAENTRNLSNIDPQKEQLRQRAFHHLMELFLNRAAEGDVRWTLTQYPCQAYAQDAEMSLGEYQDFLHAATFTDREDPVRHWQELHEQQQKAVDWLKGKKEVSLKSPHADLTLSIEGRTFINSDGKNNMPSGEIFTGPVEDSAQGWVNFTYPAIMHNREVSGVRLDFQEGKVVKASAEKNEDFLHTMLETDPGASYLGEFAIGTNYGIQKFTKSILFDEKIGGTFHLALGAGYPETGSRNTSGIHWDLICDIQENSEIRVDGELLYQDGQFMI